MYSGGFAAEHPVWYGVLGITVLFLGPVSWPILLSLFVRNTEIVRNLQLPYPSAWEYYVAGHDPAFVLIQPGKLRSGQRLDRKRAGDSRAKRNGPGEKMR